MILQWTNTGLKKRRRFEEIPSSESTPQRSGIDSTPQHSGVSDASSRSSSSPAASDGDLSVAMPRQAHSGRFVLEQLQVKCLETYLPPSGSVSTSVKGNWMWGTIALTDHGRALTSSFAALCLARTGNVLKDEGIMKQGRTQYAVALQSLQQALYDSVLAFQDRTLAAIRTLSIYEVDIQPGLRGYAFLLT